MRAAVFRRTGVGRSGVIVLVHVGNLLDVRVCQATTRIPYGIFHGDDVRC